MLRQVLLIRLKQGVTVDQVDAFVHAITEVPFPGRNNVVIGRYLGIRQGNMDLAVSNDFPDEATYCLGRRPRACQGARGVPGSDRRSNRALPVLRLIRE